MPIGELCHRGSGYALQYLRQPFVNCILWLGKVANTDMDLLVCRSSQSTFNCRTPSTLSAQQASNQSLLGNPKPKRSAIFHHEGPCRQLNLYPGTRVWHLEMPGFGLLRHDNSDSICLDGACTSFREIGIRRVAGNALDMFKSDMLSIIRIVQFPTLHC